MGAEDFTFAAGRGGFRTSGTESLVAHLVAARTFVSPAGEQALLELALTGGVVDRYSVNLEAMSRLNAEVRSAVAVMLRRQRLGADGGRMAVEALCATALNPLRIDMACDRNTGDWLFLSQFESHTPIAQRLTRVQLAAALDRLHEAIRSRLN